jgi:hypothetical protein
MRTVYIVLLLLAGALSGALVMKLAQRPVQVAEEPSAAPVPVPAAPVAQVTAASPENINPAKVAEVQTPAPATTQTEALESKPELKHPRERKPSPLRRAPDPVPVLISPRVFHRPQPQIAEAQRSPVEIPRPTSVTPIPTSPPVSPDQPKETPPARTEPENVTPAFAPINSAPEPNQATLNAGMLIPVRLLDSLSSERNHPGDAFAATLYRELVANGFVIAERGALVEGRVTASDRDARTLSLELVSVHTSDNQDVPIQTDRFDKQSEPDRSRAAAKIGGGAAIGAVIGSLAGGGKGAAIGAGAGGGIGAGDVLLSRKPASLTPETRLTFRLRAPVTITERSQ